MTTESVQKLYINDNKKTRIAKGTSKEKPSKLDTDLEIFALREQQEGLKPSIAVKHVGMIRTALAVIAERRDVHYTKISKADLKFLEETLTEREYFLPRTYVRVLVHFISLITNTAPLIPPDKPNLRKNGDALVFGRTKNLGTATDRQRIMSEHGDQITAFLDAMKTTRYDKQTERGLCAAIYVYELVNGKFDPGTVRLEDIQRVKKFMEDFGTPNPCNYSTVMIRFVSFATGNPPLRKIRSWVRKDNWTYGLSEQCPFVKQIAEYAEMLNLREISPFDRETALTQTRIFGALLYIRFGVKNLNDVNPEMVKSVCEELGTHVCPTTVMLYRTAFLNFVSYFGRDDLRQQMRNRSGMRKPFIPKDDYDKRFIEKLDDWAVYLSKWDYMPKTILDRQRITEKCYMMLKQVKGPFELESLDPLDLQTIRNIMPDFSTTTIRLYLHTFGLFIGFATGRNIFAEAPMRFSRAADRKRNFVTTDEFRTLWKIGGPMEHMILALGGSMGIRKNEMIGLKLTDFEGTTVTIRGKGIGPEGKIAKMEIPDLVRKALDEYLPFRAEIVKLGDRSDGRLLVNPNKRELGRPLSDHPLDRILKRMSEKTGIHFTAHGLRRMYAMNLADAGLDLDTVRRMMRHADVNTTLTCYLQADPRRIKSAVESINSTFSALGLDDGKSRFH